MVFPGLWRWQLEAGEAGEPARHPWASQEVGDRAPGVCGGAEYEGETENSPGCGEELGGHSWASARAGYL